MLPNYFFFEKKNILFLFVGIYVELIPTEKRMVHGLFHGTPKRQDCLIHLHICHNEHLNRMHLVEMWCTYLVQYPLDRSVSSYEQIVVVSVLRPSRVASSFALMALAYCRLSIPVENVWRFCEN